MNAPAWITALPPHTQMHWTEADQTITMTAQEVVSQFNRGSIPTKVST